MRDNRCPNCENDITATVTAAIVATLQGERPVDTIVCPHCDAELALTLSVNARLSRAEDLIEIY